MTNSSSYTPLALVANEAYAVGLAVTLQSVVQSTRPLPEIYVVDTGLAPDSRRKLEQVGVGHALPWHTAAAAQAVQRLSKVPYAHLMSQKSKLYSS